MKRILTFSFGRKAGSGEPFCAVVREGGGLKIRPFPTKGRIEHLKRLEKAKLLYPTIALINEGDSTLTGVYGSLNREWRVK